MSAHASSSASAPAGLELKFARLDCLAVYLKPSSDEELFAAVDRAMSKAGSLYRNEPVVLDFSRWDSEAPPPLAGLRERFTSSGLHVVGVRQLPEAHEEAAEALGLKVIYETNHDGVAPDNTKSSTVTPAAASKATTAPVAQKPVSSASAMESAALGASHVIDPSALSGPLPAGSLLIDGPVRSGQKIYARGGDIIVLGQVSPGAEVIADGHINVYGSLRGRALAGASGQQTARIMATSFTPELVAVAGFYMTFEQGYPAGTDNSPTQVFLDRDVGEATLRIEPIKLR